MFQCQVCNFEGAATNQSKSQEEWGMEYHYECPICGSEYTNDCVTNRAEGEVCDHCGEFTNKNVKDGEDRLCLDCFDDVETNRMMETETELRTMGYLGI